MIKIAILIAFGLSILATLATQKTWLRLTALLTIFLALFWWADALQQNPLSSRQSFRDQQRATLQRFTSHVEMLLSSNKIDVAKRKLALFNNQEHGSILALPDQDFGRVVDMIVDAADSITNEVPRF